MKKYLYLILFVLLQLITGCASNGIPYSDENNIATDKDNVYIYRPDTSISGALTAKVYIDGLYKGRLSNDGYLKFNLKKGKHTLAVEEQQLSFEVNDNNKSFFKFYYGWKLFFIVPISAQTLIEIDEASAVSKLNETKSSL